MKPENEQPFCKVRQKYYTKSPPQQNLWVAFDSGVAQSDHQLISHRFKRLKTLALLGIRMICSGTS